MTDVWITRGHAYHSHPGCPGITDGQAKAKREGKANHEPVRVALHSVQSNPAPRACQRCWPREKDWSNWLPVELETENHSGAPDGSEWELHFLRHVLKGIEQLDPGWVQVQPRVEREHREPLRPDFVIDMPGLQRIALEIDGAQKTTTPGPDDQGARIRRDAELEALGFKVQHFTNAQVTNQAAWCRHRVVELMEAVDTSSRIRPVAEGPTTSDQAHRLSSAAPSAPSSKSTWKLGAAIAAAIAAAALTWMVLNGAGEESADQFGTPPTNGECNSNAPVKGNVSESGEKIFHEPGWEFYSRTSAEVCFDNAGEAEAADYRASERQ